ncbi:MAG: right-handed parallel beta-helix repeat-containing protein [Planctomycetota bacterium]
MTTSQTFRRGGFSLSLCNAAATLFAFLALTPFSEAQSAESVDTITFLSQVDADGDGQATLADRMAVDLWVLEGGDLSAAIAGAVLRDNGTYDLRPFFDGLAAPPAGAVAAQLAEPGQGEGGEALLQGGDNCNYVEGQELPPYQEVVVSNTSPTNLQAEINNYLGGAYAANLRLRVSPGIYSRIDIDMSQLRGHLVIYAEQGPGATRIDGNNGPGSCIRVFESTLGGCAALGGSRSLTIGWNTLDDASLARPFPTDPTCASSLPTDPTAFNRGWRGFDLCEGTDSLGLGRGGGILIDRASCPVEIRGCYIHDQATLIPELHPERGAGVAIDFCEAPVSLILNQVSNNKGRNQGAGVYVEGSSEVLVAKNWIYGNTFINPTGNLTLQPAPLGGGVYAAGSSLELCQNQIYDNEARRGGGVYCHYDNSGSIVQTIYLEANDIHGNSTWTSSPALPATDWGFQGAGVYVGVSPLAGVPFSDFNRQLGFLRNRIHDNSILTTEPVGPTTIDHEVGGGVFISAGLADSGGPSFPALEENFLIGNSIYRNEARLRAGGLFLDCVTDPVRLLVFENNTIDANTTATTDPNGVPGLMLGCSGYVQWRATNNIISNNAGPGLPFKEWFACCTGTGPVTTPFEYTHAKDEFPTPCAFFALSLDLFGGVATNDSGPAGIIYPPLPNDNPHLDAASTAANTGVNPAPTWASAASFNWDIDDEPRVILSVIDRGADERSPGGFKRGDANLDASVNTADAVYILCVLFPPVPPALPCAPFACRDAADVNDTDGAISIADVVYLLNFLFSGGAPPPAPGPTTCGFDPTSDPLDCAVLGVGCP